MNAPPLAALRALAVVLLFAGLTAPAGAQTTYYWDPSKTGSHWYDYYNNWGTSAGGPYTAIWSNGSGTNTAAFSGVTGGVTALTYDPVTLNGIFALSGSVVSIQDFPDAALLTFAGSAPTIGVDSTSSLNLRLGIAGSNGLNKTGGGTVIFSEGEANVYSGLTTVQNGLISLQKSAMAIPGNLHLNGGSVQSTIPSPTRSRTRAPSRSPPVH
jgi:autotransporter-associated beta strand protein